MLFYFFYDILQITNRKEMTLARLYRIFFLPLVFLLVFTTSLKAQEKNLSEAKKIFLRIEEGISSSSIDKFSGYFSPKNYLSLSNGVTGYYSSSQSFYVLEDYLSIFQPISFKLTNISSETGTPFASGILRYNSKGLRGTALVFITLQQINGSWRISQITIN